MIKFRQLFVEWLIIMGKSVTYLGMRRKQLQMVTYAVKERKREKGKRREPRVHFKILEKGTYKKSNTFQNQYLFPGRQTNTQTCTRAHA